MCFSPTMEYFYIKWLVLVGKGAHFRTFKTLYKVNASSGEYSPFHHGISERSVERLSSFTFSPLSSPEQKTFCLLATKEQIYGEWKREMWQHEAPKTYALFFFHCVYSKFPSTVSSKTHHALNNGFESLHYLEFNVLLFWGAICTVVIGQLGPRVYFFSGKQSGLRVSEPGEYFSSGMWAQHCGQMGKKQVERSDSTVGVWDGTTNSTWL